MVWLEHHLEAAFASKGDHQIHTIVPAQDDRSEELLRKLPEKLLVLC